MRMLHNRGLRKNLRTGGVYHNLEIFLMLHFKPRRKENLRGGKKTPKQIEIFWWRISYLVVAVREKREGALRGEFNKKKLHKVFEFSKGKKKKLLYEKWRL